MNAETSSPVPEGAHPEPGPGRKVATSTAAERWLQQPLPRLHKDFYLANQDPSLQCEEFCWGNLEAAHPVIGQRSQVEVAEYRQAHGIEVEVIRGRPAPKPFQTFQETSFPTFVEEIAKELFTEDAKPFAVQAQVWPCALAGSDVIAVAPTGSGKTLAFLLPALVHIMAQPSLENKEGPIALVLEPTRELAQQTQSVAARFCARTTGEDLLRAGVVFGGADWSQQAPQQDGPDRGRWPEILVATPGRLLELVVKRRCITTHRISYVVLDEADQLLSPSGWLQQIRVVLSRIRSDRQLLFLSATWPPEAEVEAAKLGGAELVRVTVTPAIPRIPQVVRLFSDHQGGDAVQERRAALLQWVQEELHQEEALLVLCSAQPTAVQLAASLRDVASGTVAVMDATERTKAYKAFVKGEARVLVSTFALGSRGLDYADPGSSHEAAPPLSLAVIVFDFPATLKDYAHCIGRTARPGQLGGRVVAFLPETRFWIARELACLLERTGQQVPEELTRLISKDAEFLAECREAMLTLRGQEHSTEPGDGSVPAPTTSGLVGGGEFDAEKGVWVLPAELPSYRRKLLHGLADELGLPHVSWDLPEGRRLHIARKREALPDRFFIEGEKVLVALKNPKAQPLLATVVDPRIRRRERTIRLRFRDCPEEDVPVEAVRLFEDTS